MAQAQYHIGCLWSHLNRCFHKAGKPLEVFLSGSSGVRPCPVRLSGCVVIQVCESIRRTDFVSKEMTFYYCYNRCALG